MSQKPNLDQTQRIIITDKTDMDSEPDNLDDFKTKSLSQSVNEQYLNINRPQAGTQPTPSTQIDPEDAKPDLLQEPLSQLTQNTFSPAKSYVKLDKQKHSTPLGLRSLKKGLDSDGDKKAAAKKAYHPDMISMISLRKSKCKLKFKEKSDSKNEIIEATLDNLIPYTYMNEEEDSSRSIQNSAKFSNIVRKIDLDAPALLKKASIASDLSLTPLKPKRLHSMLSFRTSDFSRSSFTKSNFRCKPNKQIEGLDKMIAQAIELITQEIAPHAIPRTVTKEVLNGSTIQEIDEEEFRTAQKEKGEENDTEQKVNTDAEEKRALYRGLSGLPSSSDNVEEKADIRFKIKEILYRISVMLKEKFGLWKQFVQLEKLGEGAQGEVFRIFDPQNRKFYAKKIVKSNPEARDFNALREVLIILHILKCDDDLLLRIYSIDYEPDKECAITMEYGIGDLDSFNNYKKQLDEPWTEDEIKEVLSQVNSQIDILEDLNIYHRDIKPGNIIITEDFEFKLSDFSLSSIARNKGPQEVRPSGTPEFWAPEIDLAYKEKRSLSCDLLTDYLSAFYIKGRN